MNEYDEELSTINIQDYKLSAIQEYAELVVYSMIAFLVPFFIGQPQLLVGTLVNAALILTALNHKSTMMLPVIMLPSIAVFSRGIIFGPYTGFLLMMIPFLWLGNGLLVFTFKKLMLEKKINPIIVLCIGAFSKALLLFIAALILYNMGAIPALFLTTMGLMQFYTIITGGLMALGVQSIKKKLQTTS